MDRWLDEWLSDWLTDCLDDMNMAKVMWLETPTKSQAAQLNWFRYVKYFS